ncbi:MAG: hypothetical protein JWN67_5248 [Actinomycetia bacterium]|nr:hypothetical protein [Actinomycetes bacterium]
MIRRLVLAAALAVGLLTVAAGPASAKVPTKVTANNGNIACVWNLKPLNVGLCLGI